MVPQRAFLFGGTVASNLRYGDADADRRRAVARPRGRPGRDFVAEMDGQLEAPITQGGTNVSGGQRQRLAIARALAKRPEIYVFDDSFSALDFRTDARLRAALARDLGRRDGDHRRPARRAPSSTPTGSSSSTTAPIAGIGTHDELMRTSRPTARSSSRSSPRRRRHERPVRPGRLAPGPAGGPGPAFGARRSARRAPHGHDDAGRKPKNFRASFRRLLGELGPERRWIVVVLLASSACSWRSSGRRLLGNATNIIFDGVVGQQIPAGASIDQAIDALRAAGQTNLADMLSRSGRRARRGHRLHARCPRSWPSSRWSTCSARSSPGARPTSWPGSRSGPSTGCASASTRSSGGCRSPTSTASRAATSCRRVTNDIDNISQTLQQSLTQLITSLLTVIGVLIMMFTISPLLAFISLLAVPASMVTALLIARRSQKQFAAQWARTGTLNGTSRRCTPGTRS